MSMEIIIANRGSECVAQDRFDHTLLCRGSASAVIQEALDRLEKTGGTIQLFAGEYLLDKPLTILGNRITLKGGGRPSVLRTSPDFTGHAVLELQNASGIYLDRFSVEGNNRISCGVVLKGCGDCHVIDLFCRGFADYGMVLSDRSYLCELRGCRLAANQKANLLLDELWSDGKAGSFVPSLISNCLMFGGGHGVECIHSVCVNLLGCQVFQPSQHGFYIHGKSSSVIITGSRTFQCEEEAVRVEDSNEINLSSNIFCWHRGHGVVFKNVGWGTVSGNEVIDSGVRTHDGTRRSGILFEDRTRGVQVSGNAVFNFGDQGKMEHGIIETETCEHNSIYTNNINYCEKQGVVSLGQNSESGQNHCKPDRAFYNEGKPPYPDFDRKKLEVWLNDFFA